MSTATLEQIRPLTNDEKKAAEAAFRGATFNPTWSESARKIYQGVSAAMAARPSRILRPLTVESKSRIRSSSKSQ